MTDLTANQLAIKVHNAERRLFRAQGAGDQYEIAAAKVALQQAQEQLAFYGGRRKDTGD